ncbi:MAG TPA: HAD-IIIA family hydrolase [Aquella sp.]|nr:HAD-IIIA family hydrolase [Aquella sp.]
MYPQWDHSSSQTLWWKTPRNISLFEVTKIASFDLDWTLVKPRGTKFPKSISDNVIMQNRIAILKQYRDNGFTLVIFSNQKVTPREKLDYKLSRMDNVLQLFASEGLYFIFFVATDDDEYRKPDIGMYAKLFTLCPNIKQGFYCGDAAGRTSDFSDSDLKFADNCQLVFYTPEQVFGYH